MQTTANDIAGSAVFWTLGDLTDHQRLANAFQSAGLAKFTPEPLTNYSALREALDQSHPGCEIFPVKGSTDTFEVIRVKRDSDAPEARNVYEVVLTAHATAYGTVEINGATAPALTEKFQQLKRTVSYNGVSRAMVDIVYSLGGTTLRPSGGIYWIPNAVFERWEMIAVAVEAAGPKNRCFALRTILDENSANAIREALTQEIARESKEIDDTLSDPTSGMRAAKTARDNDQRLRRKIETYETSFEISLAELRTQLDKAVGIEAKATLLDIASAGPLLVANPVDHRPLSFSGSLFD
jgi:hypothetical protein